MSNPKADSIVKGFLEYLKKENSLDLLPQIANRINEKVNELYTLATVTSSTPLSKTQKDKILSILKANYGINSLEFKTETDLIGGIKITMGDQVIDLSLQKKFNQIEKYI